MAASNKMAVCFFISFFQSRSCCSSSELHNPLMLSFYTNRSPWSLMQPPELPQKISQAGFTWNRTFNSEEVFYHITHSAHRYISHVVSSFYFTLEWKKNGFTRELSMMLHRYLYFRSWIYTWNKTFNSEEVFYRSTHSAHRCVCWNLTQVEVKFPRSREPTLFSCC